MTTIYCCYESLWLRIMPPVQRTAHVCENNWQHFFTGRDLTTALPSLFLHQIVNLTVTSDVLLKCQTTAWEKFLKMEASLSTLTHTHTHTDLNIRLKTLTAFNHATHEPKHQNGVITFR